MATRVFNKRTGQHQDFNTREEADRYISDNYEDPNFYQGSLPELIVTPAEWQKDFHKNFGTSEIRKRVIRSLPREIARTKYNKQLKQLYDSTLSVINNYDAGKISKQNFTTEREKLTQRKKNKQQIL